jgi:hypothetical protein
MLNLNQGFFIFVAIRIFYLLYEVNKPFLYWEVKVYHYITNVNQSSRVNGAYVYAFQNIYSLVQFINPLVLNGYAFQALLKTNFSRAEGYGRCFPQPPAA